MPPLIYLTSTVVVGFQSRNTHLKPYQPLNLGFFRMCALMRVIQPNRPIFSIHFVPTLGDETARVVDHRSVGIILYDKTK